MFVTVALTAYISLSTFLEGYILSIYLISFHLQHLHIYVHHTLPTNMHINMDVFKSQIVGRSTCSINDGDKLPADVLIPQESSDEIVRHELPAPLSTLTSPMFAISQNIAREKQSGTATTQHVADKTYAVVCLQILSVLTECRLTSRAGQGHFYRLRGT
jgi:hypothetical protein